jgi:hypothetical protein
MIFSCLWFVILDLSCLVGFRSLYVFLTGCPGRQRHAAQGQDADRSMNCPGVFHISVLLFSDNGFRAGRIAFVNVSDRAFPQGGAREAVRPAASPAPAP